MKYHFIAQHAANYPVERQCKVLAVSVSGYYAWRKRQVSLRQQDDQRLVQHIRRVYENSRGVYGG